MTTRPYAARVRRGIKLLDKTTPGWRKKIKKRDLQMGNCCMCVLGQVFGGFGSAPFQEDLLGDFWSHHGFDAHFQDPEDCWDSLRDEWLLQLKETS